MVIILNAMFRKGQQLTRCRGIACLQWYLNYVDGYISKDGCKVARVCGTLDKPIAAVDVMTKVRPSNLRLAHLHDCSRLLTPIPL